MRKLCVVSVVSVVRVVRAVRASACSVCSASSVGSARYVCCRGCHLFGHELLLLALLKDAWHAQGARKRVAPRAAPAPFNVH